MACFSWNVGSSFIFVSFCEGGVISCSFFPHLILKAQFKLHYMRDFLKNQATEGEKHDNCAVTGCWQEEQNFQTCLLARMEKLLDHLPSSSFSLYLVVPPIHQVRQSPMKPRSAVGKPERGRGHQR